MFSAEVLCGAVRNDAAFHASAVTTVLRQELSRARAVRTALQRKHFATEAEIELGKKLLQQLRGAAREIASEGDVTYGAISAKPNHAVRSERSNAVRAKTGPHPPSQPQRSTEHTTRIKETEACAIFGASNKLGTAELELAAAVGAVENISEQLLSLIATLDAVIERDTECARQRPVDLTQSRPGTSEKPRENGSRRNESVEKSRSVSPRNEKGTPASLKVAALIQQSSMSVANGPLWHGKANEVANEATRLIEACAAKRSAAAHQCREATILAQRARKAASDALAAHCSEKMQVRSNLLAQLVIAEKRQLDTQTAAERAVNDFKALREAGIVAEQRLATRNLVDNESRSQRASTPRRRGKYGHVMSTPQLVATSRATSYASMKEFSGDTMNDPIAEAVAAERCVTLDGEKRIKRVARALRRDADALKNETQNLKQQLKSVEDELAADDLVKLAHGGNALHAAFVPAPPSRSQLRRSAVGPNYNPIAWEGPTAVPIEYLVGQQGRLTLWNNIRAHHDKADRAIGTRFAGDLAAAKILAKINKSKKN